MRRETCVRREGGAAAGSPASGGMGRAVHTSNDGADERARCAG